MGLLLLDQAGAPNQLLSQLQLKLNADLLSIKDSPEQGLVVCFGLACAGSLFGCRLGVRCAPRAMLVKQPEVLGRYSVGTR